MRLESGNERLAAVKLLRQGLEGCCGQRLYLGRNFGVQCSSAGRLVCVGVEVQGRRDVRCLQSGLSTGDQRCRQAKSKSKNR